MRILTAADLERIWAAQLDNLIWLLCSRITQVNWERRLGDHPTFGMLS